MWLHFLNLYLFCARQCAHDPAQSYACIASQYLLFRLIRHVHSSQRTCTQLQDRLPFYLPFQLFLLTNPPLATLPPLVVIV